MKARLLFLGTGGSVGVPMLGCRCNTCLSKDAKNLRLRPSAFLYTSFGNFLIDCGPDFRCQAIRSNITSLNGLLLTHSHHDHSSGIDDLRPLVYARPSPLPILLSQTTAQDIRLRYYYLFNTSKEKVKSKSFFYLQLLPKEEAGRVDFEGLPVQYVTYSQGGMPVNGFRIGDLAYLSDIRLFSPSIFTELSGVNTLILSALRFEKTALHFSVDEAIDFARQLNVSRIWLTHLSHDLEYHKTTAYLPEGFSLAYDGLEIDFNEDL